MKLFNTLLLASTCSAASIRGNIKNKEISKLRANGHLVDNFQPKLQNLCSSSKTFNLGDDCKVSFALEDLESTSGMHVFKSHACSDLDTIIVTMDMEDNMPTQAARLNQRSMEWTELVPMPHLEEHGCMYTTIANVDVDPKKTKHRHADGDEKRIPRRRKLNMTSSVDQDIAPVHDVGRQLQACSDYKVIRLAVRYDSRFCADHGNGTPGGTVAFANTIIELMNPFFNAAPLCMKVELCSIEGSCSANNDSYRNMLDNSNTVCDEDDSNSLIDNFRARFNPKPPQGCDSTHLFFGGDPFPNDAAGCAYLAALCDEYSVGVNAMPSQYPLIEHVLLASHELGHSLGGEHVLGENQYIMSYGNRPDSFKQENINRMRNYVNQAKAQDSTCTATQTAGPPTSPPTPAPCAGSEFRLVLQTDEYGEETSWEVTGSNGNAVAQGNGYALNSRFEINKCLPSGTDYTFAIRDTYGDGICCDFGAGKYEIFVDGSLVYTSTGQFGSEEVVPLLGGNNNSPPNPAPVPNPTPAPVPSPTPAPVPSPTSPPVNNSPTGSCPEHEFRLKLQTDEWGDEVSWELEDPNGNVVVQGGNYPSEEVLVETKKCLSSDGVHTFKIMDSYGDGMVGDAYYKLWYDGNLVLHHDGNYGDGESVSVPGGNVY